MNNRIFAKPFLVAVPSLANNRRLPRLSVSTSGALVAPAPVFLKGASLAQEDVQTGVETWVRHVTADARADAVIVKMEPCTADGRIFAYVAQLARPTQRAPIVGS